MTEAAYDTAGPYESTLQHCAIIGDKLDRLSEVLLQAEAQLLHRLATDYRAQRATAKDVYDAFLQYRPIAPTGFGKRWDHVMPSELQYRRISWTVHRYSPDDDGIWRGSWTDRKMPPRGISTVYVLFDAKNAPCYVGSSANFPTRIKWHSKDGKRFTSWFAYPCADREAAYALEERLLAEHKPYLNRKTSR